jgi:hypothetical protein
VPSSRRTTDPRRKAFLNLSGQIEGQLREAYDRRFRAGLATQSSLAQKLGVNRSAVHHRLMGHTNMTIETIADMVWALDCAINVEIYDPETRPQRNYFLQTAPATQRAAAATDVSQVNRASQGKQHDPRLEQLIPTTSARDSQDLRTLLGSRQ